MKGDYEIAKELAGELGIGINQARKGSAADRAIQYVLASRAELFHDQHGDAFIAFENEQGRREVWPLKSKAAGDFVRWCFFEQEQKGLSGDTLTTARGTLAAQARFQGQRRELSVRVARYEGAVYYDLGDWRAIAVTVDGWAVVDKPPILFRHYPHQTSQVEPLKGGSMEPFLDLLNIREQETRLLVKVYLVAGLLPGIPLPILVVQGEQGSGKSFLCRLLRALLDPSNVSTLSPPDNLREFVQLAAHHRTVYLDNLSYLPTWQSDALCRLCTGEGFSKRELYSDDDDVVYRFRGLGGISGINLVATQSDLLDRALILKLVAIPEERRLTEEELWAHFAAMRPSVLGAMFDALVEAMRRHPPVRVGRLPRLADFAQWGMVIAEALGHTAQEFLKAYGVNVAAQNEAALEASPVAQAILRFLTPGLEWEGAATDLLEELERRAEELHLNTKAREWPKAANALARKLREVAPNLRRVGLAVGERHRHGRTVWSLARQGGEKTPPIATIAPSEAGLNVIGERKVSPPGPAISPPRGQIPPPEMASPQAAGGDRCGGCDIFPTSTASSSSQPLPRKRVSL